MAEPAHPELEADAQRLVGKFLQSFALMEQALDAGIGKLLGLEDGKDDVIAHVPVFAGGMAYRTPAIFS